MSLGTIEGILNREVMSGWCSRTMNLTIVCEQIRNERLVRGIIVQV